ncbi:MAG: DUF3472 domain-containing protein [Acidimicrobiia bacterium]
MSGRAARQQWPIGYTPPADVQVIFPSLSSGPPAPCGTYMYLRWPAPRGAFDGFDSFEWDLTPELDTSQGYFWAHQFAFRDSGDPQSAGYVGLQANGSYPPGRPTKVAIFSIWNAHDARGSGVARPFGGEGTGYQTLIPYEWVAGRRYGLRIAASGAACWWVGTVRDTETGAEAEIGRILVPDAWSKLDTWSVAWTELFFPPIRHCADMECASSLWADFTANRGTLPPTSIESRFGEPARCANSRIALVTDGVVRQQMGLPAPA